MESTHFPPQAHDSSMECRIFRNMEQPKAAAYEDAETRMARGSFGGPLPIISWQRNIQGTREYMVTSWPAFWNKYCRQSAEQRRHYEIVRKGYPCKLFLDIEEDLDPGDTGGQQLLRNRVHTLARWISGQLENKLVWTGAGANDILVEDVVWLDASAPTQGKFSVHLVWQLVVADDEAGVALFKSSADVQALVEWLHVTAIHDKVACWWKPRADAKDVEARVREDALVDFAVHTIGDREFRLLYSAKPPKSAGKMRRFLRPVPYDVESTAPPSLLLEEPGAVTPTMDETQFYASLVTYVPRDRPISAILTVEFESNVRVGASGRLLGLPGEADTERRMGRSGGGRATSVRGLSDRVRQALEYVRFGMEAVCPDAATLRLERYYDTADRWCAVFRSTNHYCELQGRTHASNGVYYVCWLEVGRFYQRCLDPDCAAEYRTDIAAELQERRALFEREKSKWSAEERTAEEAFLEERRNMAGNPELRARGEVYTLEPTVTLPGHSTPFPLWQMLVALGRIRLEESATNSPTKSGNEDDAEPEYPAAKRPRLVLDFNDLNNLNDDETAKECKGQSESESRDELESTLDQDQAEFQALFA